MGNTQSVLEKKGYTILRKVENGVIATDKDGDQFVIKEIKLNEPSDLKASAGGIFSEVETLLQINHPHVLSHKNSFQDDTNYYVVTDHCDGGNLAQKIKEGIPFSEEQMMDWFVKICMALKHVHELGLLHRDLRPQNIFLTKFGTLCLGDFGRVNENASQCGSSDNGMMGYLGPESLTGGIYDTKSDIWSLGCVLYELCMLQSAFTAASTIKLIPKILGGPYPSLPESFSPELHKLLCDIFQRDPTGRPSAGEILAEPFIISFLIKKNEKTGGAPDKFEQSENAGRRLGECAPGHHHRQSDWRCYWGSWRNHFHSRPHPGSLHSWRLPDRHRGGNWGGCRWWSHSRSIQHHQHGQSVYRPQSHHEHHQGVPGEDELFGDISTKHR
ncbi:serine/threonine-protein kinase Nek1 isoform X2 [Salmo salar]|uniref:non-specific serine/threonine protein kinase n=1 Tax=Salmo salar TaxID=8030 RepID=A0A1S3N971_SALSA|nr:serine/threonine-protein kinase Nek1-like isoform X2 [Salmo salar]